MDVSQQTQQQIDCEIDRLLAKYQFWEFCLWYDREFFEQRQFLRQVADAFQWVYEEYIAGRARRITVSMPPRTGKSYITSLFCAWWLGKLPEQSVMRNACTAKLYRKFSYDVRKIIRSMQWKSVFPGTYLSANQQSVEGWNLEQARQVSYFGAGVGGTIIGFGANLAISDDLYSGMEDALSETYNDTVEMWKQSDHDSRKEKNCPEIFIGTRWTLRDVIGRAIEEGKIDRKVIIPALINGKSFCEDVKSTEEYLQLREETDEAIWEAEYMQEPIENKGVLFPLSELKLYDPNQVDLSKSEFAMMQIDPADTGGDFYAAPCAFLIDDRVYIDKVIFNTNGTDSNIPDSVELAVSRRLNQVNVEGNSAWILLGKDIRQKIQERYPDCEVRIIKNTTNKETRILAGSSWVKNHVYFRSDYRDDRQYYAFIRNITGYLREGGNKHDDAPDVLAGLSSFFQSNFSHLW